ncbi:MAG: hypothetical protein OXC07_02690, partial [Kistimonas sp.]|nr:hypothetical protein [Kistimonas sp.]
CARVCRHWHDCLPAPRQRLSRWLQQHAPVSWLANPHLALGFNSRTRSFLQAANSPVLPALMHLQQEQEQEQQKHRLSEIAQDAQQPSLASPADPLLSRLLDYGLNQQLTRADQLRLHKAEIDWPPGIVSRTHFFSPCSRWLAIQLQMQPQAPRLLRLYGWEQGAWRQQVLVPDTAEPVGICRFPSLPADTLISVHGLDILTWRRVPGSRDWHCTPLWRVTDSHAVREISTLDNGGLVLLTSRTQTELLVQFFAHTGSGTGWDPVVTATYTSFPLFWAMEEQSCQLAIGECAHDPCHNHFINKVHIWHRVHSTDSQQTWEHQTTVLSCHDARIKGLAYSPGGHYLAGRLSNDSICLWQLDAQHQLLQQLTLPDCQLPTQVSFYRLAPFSRDATQLAMPCSLRHIQLCYRDDNNHWQYGQRLEAPPLPAQPRGDMLEDIMMSSSGRTLVRVTLCHLDIWHRDPAGHWEHLLQRIRKANAAFFPTACFMEPGELVCTTVQDPELSLWIHGPDSQGQLVRKACMTVEVPISGRLAVTSDGLSLLLSTAVHPPTLLHLEPPQVNATGSQAEQALTPVSEPAPRQHRCQLL